MDIDMKFLFCGDSAIAVQFGEVADIEINLRVRALDMAIKANPCKGIIETIPTYRSVMIYYDPLIIRYDSLCSYLRELATSVDWNAVKPSNEIVVVPIFYRAPQNEIHMVADYEKLSVDDVIRIHTGKEHYAFMLGVAPGTVYLSVPKSFTIPRKAVPRPKPYASSIQIWSTHTTISSFHSQSGWYFMGRVPASSYNPNRPEDPFLVKPGQWVKFREVDETEFEHIEQEFQANRYEREIILREPK